ncbi:MAG: hypothetical protein IPN86_14645 [Saprospiraceae bacterium]|nr:hypothetical protein [Saprospiraceae bacterium]
MEGHIGRCQDEADFSKSVNPFSIIILTVLLEIKKSRLESKEPIDLKIDIVKKSPRKRNNKE